MVDVDFAVEILDHLQELFAWWAPSCREEKENVLAPGELFETTLLHNVESFSLLLAENTLFLEELLADNLFN